jgi:uncharacterized membrane protein
MPPEPPDAGANWQTEIAALNARVAALEQELAALKSQPAPQPTGPPVIIQWRTTALPGSSPAPVISTPPPQPSLEDRIGSQIFSRAGIVAMLFGITWFLKWAIDNHWIGQTGRILCGLIAGAALILWSERFRRKDFSAFSYSLKAVGSGAVYLSLWAAFQLYHLLPAPVALAAMLLVTAWNAWMAWVQDAELLAGYALTGAFLSPLLLSTGGNHEVFLFTYLATIDIACLALVRLKPWPRLLVAAFPITVLYFIGWYSSYFQAAALGITSLFIILFAITFASVPLSFGMAIPPRRSQLAVVTEDILIPLANAGFLALAFYSVLQDSGHHNLLPWLILLLAAVYLGVMRLGQSAAAASVHLSIAVVFLTIAIPLKASGRWITIGWLVEGAVLLWTAQRLAASEKIRHPERSAAESKDLRLSTSADELSASIALRWLAAASLALGFCGLISLPFWLFGAIPTAFFNQRFATALVGLAAFAVSASIANRARAESSFWPTTAAICTLAFNLIALQSIVTEIVAFWRNTPGPDQRLASNLAISAFLMIYGAALLAAGFWRRSPFLRWQALVLIVATIVKVFCYDISGLSQGYRVASFLALGALLLGVSFAYQKNLLGLRASPTEPPQGA